MNDKQIKCVELKDEMNLQECISNAFEEEQNLMDEYFNKSMDDVIEEERDLMDEYFNKSMDDVIEEEQNKI